MTGPVRTLFVATAWLGSIATLAAAADAPPAADASLRGGPLKVLFLGDRGHHKPGERFAQLEPVLAPRGIELVYTENLGDLDPAKLAAFDALAVYANIDTLPPAAEAAILEFVRNGKGLVPLHCASYCFRNSPAWIDLVGAQFQKHGTREFRTLNVAPDHPLMRGFGGFRSWDETYVHSKHNDRGRTVLEERVDGDTREPWTWVRSEGKGRVFYTAWGHDERTWGHPGFHNLVERGIRFAAGRDPAAAGPYVDHPAMTTPPAGLEPFAYEPARIPFYKPGGDRKNMTSGGEEMQMQKPLSPEESRKHAITPVGFRVELFASEPLLVGKPLAFCFDADGAVFVAESVDYPNDLVEPAAADPAAPVDGHDRIVKLVDGDGDGRADRRVVFADQLSIPTSMLAHDGGLIVVQAPHTLYLKDTDGDGRADLRKILFTGWGTGDTHAGPSSLTWGLDGWVYGMVGYSGFNGTVGGEKHQIAKGFFRFLPDGSRFEALRSTNNNSWGFGFSEEGLVFGSTANGNPSEHMPLANRVYERVRGWSATTLGGIAGSPEMELAPRTSGDGSVPIRQVDHHGRFTAAAGHRLYTARAYPREYWNRTAFVCEPTGHIVATFVLQPQGAAFTSRMAWDLVASDDEWTAPIQAEVGPDGQVWVIDWYNFIVQHNPTPTGFETGKRGAYVTPLRDKSHGRIWRVVHGGSPDVARRSLAASSPDQLVAALRDDNMFWRERAQRKLVERAAGRADGGRDVLPAVVQILEHPQVDAIGLDAGAIHALWTLRLVGGLEGPHADARAVAAVRSAVAHASAGVRMNAVKVLPRDEASLAAIAAAAHDPEPLVRLAVLEALGEHAPAAEAGRIVVEMLADPRTLRDPVLADAATAAAAAQAAAVLPQLLSADGPLENPAPRRLQLVERVAEHVARGGDAAAVGAAIVRLEALVAQGKADNRHTQIVSATLAGLARGWPKGETAALGAAADAALVTLVEKLPAADQGQVVTLAQHTGSRALDPHVARISAALVAEIDRADAADTDRAAAAERLVVLRPADPRVVAEVIARVGGRSSPELSAGLVAALAKSTAAEAPAAILDRLGGLTPQVREAAVRTVLSNRDWASRLVERLEAGSVRLGDIPLADRVKLTDHPDRAVRDRAKKILAAGGGLPSADRQQVIDDILPVVLAGGDAVRGKAVYKEHCGKCHTHSGEGGKVGPELTGMAVHPAHELLIHILDPNRSVEGNYRAYTVSTDDGRVVTGLLAAESRTAVEIVDAEGKRHAIQRAEIDEFAPSPNSLMPVGFEKQIKPAGFADLLAFLTARGKFVPLSLEKVATAVSTKGMFYNEKSATERLVFSDWGPKTFRGVPFRLVDPQGQGVPNVVMLHGPTGYLPPQMPTSVSLPLASPVRAIHLLGGIAGWGFPATPKGSTSMIVRLVYADGQQEDHRLVNGEHVADYIRRVDVPESEWAFDLGGRQVRFVSVRPARQEPLVAVEFVKGNDATAPVIMAVTAEMP
jgi:putative membrane-bound dehydrogenase-like protein